MRRLDATRARARSLAATASRCVLLGTLISLTAISWAGAQTVYNWDPPPHANVFSTPTNWTPTGPPGTTGEARFNTTLNAYSVSFSNDPTNARVRVGNDHVTFNLNGHTYTLTTTSTSSPSIMVGGITLADDALLTIRDGTLAGQHAVIAPAIFQTAAGMVVDTGGTLDLAGTFTVGKQLPGSLVIQNGGDVTSATGVLGESGNGNGLVTVTGAGSTWHNSGSVYVGGQAAIDGGNGTLSIIDKGLVEIGGTLKIWPGGTVALNGGTLRLPTVDLQIAGGTLNWTAGTLQLYGIALDPSGLFGDVLTIGAGKILHVEHELQVGSGGAGSLNVSGGHVEVTAALPGQGIPRLIMGDEPLGSGTISVSGGTLTVNGEFILGENGMGSLELIGLAQTGDANLGLSPGSRGEALVTMGSKWIVGQTAGLLGRLVVGGGGVGTIDVTQGGEVNARTMQIGLGSSADGAINVDGPNSLLFVHLLLSIGIDGVGSLAVTNGARAQVLGQTTIGLSGQLSGDALFQGNVSNGGVVAPGASAGALSIEGDYAQSAAGKLCIELAGLAPGTQYDQLLITGDAMLNGTLEISLLDGFLPSSGQSYSLLTANDVDGLFAVEMLPSVPGLIFDVIYNPNSVVLTVSSMALPGDYNADGTVDAADYVVWRKNDGTPAGYDTWRAHFGESIGSGAGAASTNAAVPEPCTLMLALAGLGIWTRRRVKHQRNE